MNSLSEIIRSIEHEWPAKRVLVIGDVMLDKYLWGQVERVSPEAPVPVVSARHQSEQPGGAANVAMNLAGLGAKATVLGFAGEDDERIRLTSALTRGDVTARLVTVPGIPTTSKLRILSGSQQMLRVDTESRLSPDAPAHEELQRAARELIEDADAVILSDYGKGVLCESTCRVAIECARSAGIPVLVDPKTKDFSRYRGATTICPNLHELSAAVHCDSSDLQTLLAEGSRLVPKLQLDFLLVTLSDKGIAAVWENSQVLAPAVAREVFDVSGAGDTVISVIGLCLACGVPIEKAIEVANAAAGVVVSKIGTVPIQRAELLVALEPKGLQGVEDKVLPLDDMVGRVAGWRAAGQRVVFTNGCFDLLHVGHIAVLEKARREGDRLIVGLNSDSSVRDLKGPSRPINGQLARAQVLAALAAVDGVVIFEEPTPIRLIEALRPHVIVKGGDYTEQTVVGSELVRSWGGRVAIIPTVEGFSTTKLIEKSAAPS